MNNFYYVYVLTDMATGNHHYVGYTKDIRVRLKAHNAGQVSHTAKYKPWQITTCTSFSDKQKAIAFEQYLKSHSGRAFASKHF